MTIYRVYEFPVVVPSDKEDYEQNMRFEIGNDGVVTITLDGKKIADCDWEDNLKEVIKKMLEQDGLL